MRSAQNSELETWDRLTLLLITKPAKGWEEIYEAITRREVERLAPREEQIQKRGPTPTKVPAPDPEGTAVDIIHR